MLRLPPRLTEVRVLGFGPDNRHLLAVGLNRRLGGLLRFDRLALWDLSDPAAAPPLGITAGFDPSAAFFLPDGRVVGIDSRGEWRAALPGGGPVERCTRPASRGKFHPAAISPDGRHVALIGRDVFRCDPLTGDGVGGWGRDRYGQPDPPRPDTPTPSPHRSTVLSTPSIFPPPEYVGAAFSPDGQQVAVGFEMHDNRGVTSRGSVYDAATGERLAGLASADGNADRVAWSPDGRFVVLVGPAGFRVYDADTGAVVAVWEWADGDLTAAAFHPAGRVFATGTRRGHVLLWEVGGWGGGVPEDGADRPPERSLAWGVGPVQAVAFSPDGSLGAVAGRDGEILVWDADG